MDLLALTMEEWIEGVVNTKFKEKKHKAKTSDGKTLVSFLSDLHVGELTDQFNYKIACDRMEDMAEELALRHKKYDYDEVVVCLGGDLVDGSEVFGTQNAGLEFEPFTQVVLCVEMLWRYLVAIRVKFDCLVRVESWFGNHGVIDKTSSEVNNYDNFVTKMLSLLADHSQFKNIVIAHGYKEICLFEVKGWAFMGIHKGPKHTGTPAMTTKIGAWNGLNNVDVYLIGHWHTASFNSWIDKVIIYNGGLPGGNSFSDKLAVSGPARQTYFTVTQDCRANGFGYVEW